jgi:hypothetical protein
MLISFPLHSIKKIKIQKIFRIIDEENFKRFKKKKNLIQEQRMCFLIVHLFLFPFGLFFYLSNYSQKQKMSFTFIVGKLIVWQL